MAWILCIESATKSCSVALAKDDQWIDVIEEVSEKYSHSEQLTPFIQKLLSKHQISFQNLNAIAFSSGPGSYTGLRIGLSTAKGLCYALDIPLISVSTLEAMANLMKAKHPQKVLCPMVDARRMEVYCALYGAIHSPISAKVIDQDSFVEELEKHPLLFFGDGADKCHEVITHPNAHFELGIYPSAKGMLELAFHKFSNKDFEDLAYYEPFYLKEFVTGVKKA